MSWGTGACGNACVRQAGDSDFQGLLKNEGKERYGVLYKQWQKNAANFSIDGHYLVRELRDCARSCWERIPAHEGKSVLVSEGHWPGWKQVGRCDSWLNRKPFDEYGVLEHK